MLDEPEWIPTRPMRYELLVSSILLVVVLVAAAGYSYVMKSEALSLGFAIAAGACGMLAIGSGIIERSRQTYAAGMPGGLLYKSGNEVREIAHADVVAAALEKVVKYKEGSPSEITRKLTLELQREDGSVEKIPLETKYPASSRDPLEEAVLELTEALTARARKLLASGKPVNGPDWVWEGGTLTFSFPKGDPLLIHVNDVVAVDNVEGKVCIWERGSDEAAIRIPNKATNSYLLEDLLEERLKSVPPPAQSADPTSLGRVIFERRGENHTVLYVIAAVVIAFAIGMGMAFLSQREIGFLIAGGVGLLIGVICWVCGFLIHGDYFRVHERGCSNRSFSKQRELLDSQVSSFSFASKKIYVRHNHGLIGVMLQPKGTYAGTTHTLTLVPIEAHKSHRIEYSVRLQKNDEELERLCDRLAKQVGAGLFAELQVGRPVKWTDNLELRSQGLAYRPTTFFFLRKDWQYAPYERIAEGIVEDGEFKLFLRDQKAIAYQEPSSSPNFYAGYAAFQSMLQRPLPPRVRAVPEADPYARDAYAE